METVVIASKNPVKIKATEEAFKKMFPGKTFKFVSVASNSGVSHQPIGEETLTGAINRVRQVKQVEPHADYWVGSEGGIVRDGHNLYSCGWSVVMSKDGRIGKSTAGYHLLPKKVSELINKGLELGEANDKVYKMTSSKRKQGSVGILTGGVIDRKEMTFSSIVLALVQFKNPDLY